MGNLRQRNQQATLLSMGLWALLGGGADRGALRASSARELGAGLGRLHGAVGPGLCGWSGILTAWALALLAVGSAATASRRAGAIVSDSGSAGAVARSVQDELCSGWCGGLAIYAQFAAWFVAQFAAAIPVFVPKALFACFGDAPGCTSRRCCSAFNVLAPDCASALALAGAGGWIYALHDAVSCDAFCVLLDNAQ